MNNRARLLPLACALFALGGGAATPVVAAQGPSIEYQVKAAFLAKFTPFVHWPTGSLAPGQPVRICVSGPDPFGVALDRLNGQSVGSHRIVVRRLARARDGSDCHVMYIRRSSNQSTAAALAEIRGSPVLTVTDAADGAAARGIVHFIISRNRVRFEVDAQAASDNRLALSSKLQSLALSSPSSAR